MIDPTQLIGQAQQAPAPIITSMAVPDAARAGFPNLIFLDVEGLTGTAVSSNGTTTGDLELARLDALMQAISAALSGNQDDSPPADDSEAQDGSQDAGTDGSSGTGDSSDQAGGTS